MSKPAAEKKVALQPTADEAEAIGAGGEVDVGEQLRRKGSGLIVRFSFGTRQLAPTADAFALGFGFQHGVGELSGRSVPAYGPWHSFRSSLTRKQSWRGDAPATPLHRG